MTSVSNYLSNQKQIFPPLLSHPVCFRDCLPMGFVSTAILSLPFFAYTSSHCCDKLLPVDALNLQELIFLIVHLLW